MAYLYVTTDAFEAETLIENPGVGQESTYRCNDIEFFHGESLVNRLGLGFNPMCSVEMNGDISLKALDLLATRLVKQGLYVATDMDGTVQIYTPKDAEARSELVKLAMQKPGWIRGVEPASSLLRYSNNPNEIRDFS